MPGTNCTGSVPSMRFLNPKALIDPLARLIPVRLTTLKSRTRIRSQLSLAESALAEQTRKLRILRNALADELLSKPGDLPARYWDLLDLPHNADTLLELSGRHRGCPCVIVGNGPSVQIGDLERLGSTVTFGCNKLFLAYDKTSFRPTYTVVADNQVIEDFGAEIAAKSESVPIFAIPESVQVSLPTNAVKIRQIAYPRGKNVVHETPLWGLSSIGSVVIVAIQLAYFMGCQPIFLYGIDHSFRVVVDDNAKDIWRRATNDGNHFIENYRQGRAWAPPDYGLLDAGFLNCQQFLAQKGREVINLSRETKLTSIRRASFDEYF